MVKKIPVAPCPACGAERIGEHCTSCHWDAVSRSYIFLSPPEDEPELRHRGYCGEMVADAGSPFVMVRGICDFVSASLGPNDAPQSVFCELVDDYLATCQELDRTPQLLDMAS